MDQDCVVFGCRNSSVISQAKKNDCNFFNFPLSQPDLLARWLKKLSLERWTPGPENVICEEHFCLESFEIVNDKRSLKSDAVPSMIDDWRRIFASNDADDAFLDVFDEHIDDGELSKDIRCRICASFLSTSNAIDISSKDDNVMEKIMACIPILVKSADSLPKHICRMCLTDLNISYRMLVRAIESEKLFNNLLNKSESKLPQHDEGLVEKLVDVEKTSSDCVICNIHFDNIEDLSNHFQEKHVDELDFIDQDVIKKPSEQIECDGFNDEELLTFVEEKDIANQDPGDGTIIELGFERDPLEREDKEDADQIIDTMFIKTKWKCNVCSMSFASKEILDFHAENFHKSEELAGQSTYNESINLVDDTEHDSDQNTGDDGQYSVCQFCMQVFYTADELNEHLESHIESLACDVCGFVCQDAEKLKKHRETHKRSNKNNTCTICFTVFLSHSDMVQHSKDVHRIIKDTKEDAPHQKWICKYCGKEIGTKLSLSIHERIHTGVRPYVCECCGRSFKSKANLIQHQPVHTGIKRYKCSVCDKAFARKAFVTTHMRVHTGERPYKCEICGNRYTQIGDMRRHKKRHLINEATTSINATSIKPTPIPTIPARASIQPQQHLLVDDNKTETMVADPGTAVIENTGLIKLHFAKDVTDFRRILVELQQ